jgi:hypothetical protein
MISWQDLAKIVVFTWSCLIPCLFVIALGIPTSRPKKKSTKKIVKKDEE